MVKRAEILQELDFIDGKLAELVIPAVDRLEKDKDIVCVYLFGSTAKGQDRPESDLDFAVLLNKDYPEDALLSKRLFLIKVLRESIPGKKIDAVILNEAPIVLAFKVIAQGRLLFSRDEKERVHFEVRAMQNYYDFKPFLEKNLARRIIKKHLLFYTIGVLSLLIWQKA